MGRHSCLETPPGSLVQCEQIVYAGLITKPTYAKPARLNSEITQNINLGLVVSSTQPEYTIPED